MFPHGEYLTKYKGCNEDDCLLDWSKFADLSEVLAASMMMMMEAVSINESSVNLDQTTPRSIPEDSRLHTTVWTWNLTNFIPRLTVVVKSAVLFWSYNATPSRIRGHRYVTWLSYPLSDLWGSHGVNLNNSIYGSVTVTTHRQGFEIHKKNRIPVWEVARRGKWTYRSRLLSRSTRGVFQCSYLRWLLLSILPVSYATRTTDC